MTTTIHITPAMLRALTNVKIGRVDNVFTPAGNTFQAPTGASQTYRKLQSARLIEDEPGHKIGVYTTRIRQRLTDKGREALGL
jgi:hypothetical protein